MKLSPFNLYPHLPKKNCRECGESTCLAFAVKLLNREAELEKCPHVNDEQKSKLKAMFEPPVKEIRYKGYKMGGEEVIHRHELTFHNLPLIASKNRPDIFFERAGKRMSVELKEAQDDIGGIIWCKEKARADESIEKAKKDDLPVIMRVNSIEEAKSFSTRYDKIMVEFHGSPAEVFRNLKDYRERAIKGEQGCNLPTMFLADDEAEAAYALMRYANIVVINNEEKEFLEPFMYLRQAIFSDPRIPAKVDAILYKIGTPDENSPIFVVGNYALTYYTVSGDINSQKINSYLIAFDTEGLSVWTAVAANKFLPSKIREVIENSRLSERVKNRTLVIPGFAAPLKGAIAEETGWKVVVGPEDSREIGNFIEEMKREKQ
ncbi:hypothetical protein COV19_02535 [Candidatus Woesearchaeota archaeon CG10_big_fil_rev_8_21_14_0_10_44_13]|nr:MAG: hypothetical protein COV19_02535 [Candidatus Woesearchaeota archaeon CG10_big_fil_rev_8_21_14_0_10_44_13]